MPLEIWESSEETWVDLWLSKTNWTKDWIKKDVLNILEESNWEKENIKSLWENLFFVSEIKEDIHKPIDSFEIDMSTPYWKFLLLNSKWELKEIYNEKRIVWAKLIEWALENLEKYILILSWVNRQHFEWFLKYKEWKITQFISNISKSIPHDKEKIISELLIWNPVYIQFKNWEKHLVLMKNWETYYLNLEKYFPNENLWENITKMIQIKDELVYILKEDFGIQDDLIYSKAKGVKWIINIIKRTYITTENSLNELDKYYDLVDLETLWEWEVLWKEKNEKNDEYLDLLRLR